MAADHSPDHPLFIVRAFPNGVIDVSVCWDQIDVPQVAKALRLLATTLEALPPDTTGEGVVPR